MHTQTIHHRSRRTRTLLPEMTEDTILEIPQEKCVIIPQAKL